MRTLGDGTVIVSVPAYLTAVGLDDLRIGVVVTLTLLGSAALTLTVGFGHTPTRAPRLRRLASLLMVATGIGFAACTSCCPLALVRSARSFV